MSSFGIMLSQTFSVLMIGELPLYNYTAVELNAQNLMSSNTDCCYSSTSQRIHRGSRDIMFARREGSVLLIYHPSLHAVSNPANKSGTAGVEYEKHTKGRQSRGLLCENSLLGCTIQHNDNV